MPKAKEKPASPSEEKPKPEAEVFGDYFAEKFKGMPILEKPDGKKPTGE